MFSFSEVLWSEFSFFDVRYLFIEIRTYFIISEYEYCFLGRVKVCEYSGGFRSL